MGWLCVGRGYNPSILWLARGDVSFLGVVAVNPLPRINIGSSSAYGFAVFNNIATLGNSANRYLVSERDDLLGLNLSQFRTGLIGNFFIISDVSYRRYHVILQIDYDYSSYVLTSF